MWKSFEEANFARVIKLWGYYKDVYLDKVASNTTIDFIVGKSYLSLGLVDAYKNIEARFAKNQDAAEKTFPNWFPKKSQFNKKLLVPELELVKNLKLKNYKAAKVTLKRLQKLGFAKEKGLYYEGLINYRLAEYKQAVRKLEDFLAGSKTGVILDGTEVAQLLEAYTESIYRLSDLDRYLIVARAILKDTKNYSSENSFMKKMRERIAHVEIEILSSKRKTNEVELRAKQFDTVFPKSNLKGRVNYLLGVSYLKNKKEQKGEEVLNRIIKDNTVSGHIKALAKSELSLLKIKKRTI